MNIGNSIFVGGGEPETRAELVAPGTVPPSAYPPRIYIRLGEGSVLPAIILRKWGCEPFEDGTEYVLAPPQELPDLADPLADSFNLGAQGERARIVAWLNGLHWTHRDREAAGRFAKAIEEGLHYV